jgi:hypothetical protein
MKLTEQQLAQLFRQSKNDDMTSHVEHLSDSMDASDQRLTDVEKIADNSRLSASYHLINRISEWSDIISKDIELKSKNKFSFAFIKWLKPTIATAAILTAVYFVSSPKMIHELEKPVQTNNTMFTGSFEKSVVKDNSSKIEQPTKSDTIYKSTFS